MGLWRISGATHHISRRKGAARVARRTSRDGGSGGDRRGAGRAETVGGALVKAYLNNPRNQPSARRSARPGRRSPQGECGLSADRNRHGRLCARRTTTTTFGSGGVGGRQATFNIHPRGYGVTVNETVFNGNRTINSIRAGRIAGAGGAREVAQHRTEHAASTASPNYMDVLRDTAILELAPQQRRGVAGAVARDQGPFHGRRSDAHRRRAGGGESGRARRRPH